MNTVINVHLSATLLSKAEDRWLVTSAQEGDVPIALEVNGQTAHALINLSKLYNRMPDQVMSMVVNHYSILIRIVRSFRLEANRNADKEAWKNVPLIGITEEIDHTDETEEVVMKEVKYLNTQDAIRLVYGFVDIKTYTALSAIINAYTAEPMLWHYVMQKYWRKIETFIGKQ